MAEVGPLRDLAEDLFPRAVEVCDRSTAAARRCEPDAAALMLEQGDSQLFREAPQLRRHR